MVERLVEYRIWVGAALIATLLPLAIVLVRAAYDPTTVERYRDPETFLRLILISYGGGVS